MLRRTTQQLGSAQSGHFGVRLKQLSGFGVVGCSGERGPRRGVQEEGFRRGFRGTEGIQREREGIQKREGVKEGSRGWEGGGREEEWGRG